MVLKDPDAAVPLPVIRHRLFDGRAAHSEHITERIVQRRPDAGADLFFRVVGDSLFLKCRLDTSHDTRSALGQRSIQIKECESPVMSGRIHDLISS